MCCLHPLTTALNTDTEHKIKPLFFPPYSLFHLTDNKIHHVKVTTTVESTEHFALPKGFFFFPFEH